MSNRRRPRPLNRASGAHQRDKRGWTGKTRGGLTSDIGVSTGISRAGQRRTISASWDMMRRGANREG